MSYWKKMAGSSSKYKCSARSLLSYYVSAPKRDFPDGPLYAMRPNHLGWILFIIMPGASLPALLTHGFGIRPSHAVLEQVST
jgi:hypothetical protein